VVLWNIEPETRIYWRFFQGVPGHLAAAALRSPQRPAAGPAGSLHPPPSALFVSTSPNQTTSPSSSPDLSLPYYLRACLPPRPQSWLRPGYAQACSLSSSSPASSSFWRLHLPGLGLDSPPSSITSDPRRLQDSSDRSQTPVWRRSSTVRRRRLLRCLRRRRRVCSRMRKSCVRGRGDCWIRCVVFGVHLPLLVQREGL
jgi:hypothetical protein